MSDERFYTLGEVQTMLTVSRSTLWRWTAEHGLRVIRIGAVTRIRESDLRAFLERHEGAMTVDRGPQGNSKVETKRAIESSPSPHSRQSMPLE
jgi:excisionase family DNA binding protein